MSGLKFDVTIVGGGLGGAQAALTLRQHGFEGSIAIIGEEVDLPYERPALSKDYLLGTKAWSRLLLRTADRWAERDIRFLLGCKAVSIAPSLHRLTLDDGQHVDYGKLIWAAGGSPRQLTCDGHQAIGVNVVRSRADVDRLLSQLPDAKRTLIIGAGYIGLEAAAVLSKLGQHITVVETQDRVLARVAGEPLSRFLETEHRSHDVVVELGASVARIEASNGKVRAVCLTDGRTLPADIVIVGIGIKPLVAPLLEAGAAGGNGVRVNEFCQTSLPDIFAIGDCAEHASIWADGEWLRIESVQNANDMAVTAARFICGKGQPYAAIPWFWSNQYDLRLQTVGLSRGFDQIIVRGDPGDRKFSLIYLRDRKVIALDCLNAPGDFAQGKSLVSNRVTLEAPEALADPGTPLKLALPAA